MNATFGAVCVLAIIVFSNASMAADRDPPAPVPLETLDVILRDFSSIYAGLTRADVKRILRQDGGIYKANSTRFVHPLCQYCKILITFEAAHRNADGSLPISESDRVTAVSKPYLEPMFTN